MDSFMKFLVASVAVHAALFYVLQGSEWFTPPQQAERTAEGFDSSRVRAVFDRMRTSETAPIPDPPPPPRGETAREPETRTSPAEVDLTDRYVAPPARREEPATGSLAPSNLNEILDLPLRAEERRGPQLETPSRTARREPGERDSSDLEKAWKESRITASEVGGAGGDTGEGGGPGKGSARGAIASSGFVMGGKGEIPRTGVEAALQKKLTQMQNCYQGALLESPGLEGKLILRWTISARGEVEEVIVEKSQLENAELHSCIVQEISKSKFPKPEGGPVIIRYPLTFNIKSY